MTSLTRNPMDHPRRDRCAAAGRPRRDAGHRTAAARRAGARAGEGCRADQGGPRPRAARSQHRDPRPARPARPLPPARPAVPARRLLRRHPQARAPAGFDTCVRPRHPADHHGAAADRARPRARRRDPARLRGGRAQPGRGGGDRRAGRRQPDALALPGRLRRRAQHGAQAARHRLPRRAQPGRHAAGRGGVDRLAGDDRRRGGRGAQDPAALRGHTARRRGVPLGAPADGVAEDREFRRPWTS